MRAVALVMLSCALVVPAGAGELDPVEGYRLIHQLMSEDKKERKEASEALLAAGDVSLVPGMVDALFFTPRLYRAELVKTLKGLTDETSTLYRDWVTYVGEREDIVPKDRYVEWKAAMFQRIDPRYSEVFYPGAPARIRLQEVISGGVALDGIPSVDDPPLIAGDEAGYLQKNERVFGVEIAGEAVAYPLRILSWHEMLNDEVGGEPITLSYCTLCGSGILYSRRVGDAAPTFGTSGLLYRSNKLMYDRESLSLWSNLTGEAVVGKQAAQAERLRVLPMTLTTWGEWRERHPESRTIDMKALQRASSDIRFDYTPGAAERAREGVSFPVWQQSDALPGDDEVYVLKIGNDAKAYPLEILLAKGLVHDQIGAAGLVLVADEESQSVRAYASGGRQFRRDEAGNLIDDEGDVWNVREAALESGSGQPPLARVPGHVAYWFGWYAFYPDTEIYRD